MRVLHVITSLRTGGAEKLMVDLLPRLRDLGHEVHLCVFDGVRTPFVELLEQRGIKIISLSVGRNVYDLRHIFKLKSIICEYDIVHSHNTAPQFFVPIARKLACAKCRIITTEHSTSNRRRSHSIMRSADRWMYSQYEKIICVSDISGNNIKEYSGLYELPIVAIPNGINYSIFSSAKASKDISHFGGDIMKGVMVAGFRYEKDHATVIDAYSLLPESYHLFLVGDGEKRAEYEQMISSLHLENRIHLLGVRGDVPNLLRAADYVIMSSHREGLSLSNLEGMACGHPFIASDVEGLHEIVYGYGILFPHKDSKALAEVIIKVSEDPAYAENIAKKCQQRALQFDIQVMVERYNEVYLHD